MMTRDSANYRNSRRLSLFYWHILLQMRWRLCQLAQHHSWCLHVHAALFHHVQIQTQKWRTWCCSYSPSPLAVSIQLRISYDRTCWKSPSRFGSSSSSAVSASDWPSLFFLMSLLTCSELISKPMKKFFPVSPSCFQADQQVEPVYLCSS